MPASLAGPSVAVAHEQAAALAYYGARSPWTGAYNAYGFANYRGRDVKLALRLLAGGNCAYCESKIGAVGAREVEHYRPKGGIEGLPSHPGYWWLALDWDNLLPTCRDCNKSLRQYIVTPGMTRAEVLKYMAKTPDSSHGKANQFDVLGTRLLDHTGSEEDEDPLLIDPCKRDPADHLCWDFESELTLIEAKETPDGACPYGSYTIRTCALNRADLVLDRIPALRPLRVIRDQVVDQLNRCDGDPDALADIMAQVDTMLVFAEPDQPYAGMAAAYLEAFEVELGAWRLSQGIL